MLKYSGTDNLEIMAEAVNYNKFLLGLLCKFAVNSKNIVDFGAGIGTFANAMWKNGFFVHCIETDEIQSRFIESQGLPVKSSLLSLGLNQIDFIYALNVLEHIEDDGAVLRQMHLSLVPGGFVFIYVPAFEILFSSMDYKVGHFRRYTKKDLIEKLQSANFIIEDAQYGDSVGFIAALAFRFINNGSGQLNKRTLIFYDRIIFPISRLCDQIFHNLFGKNVWVLARKPDFI
jgi:SAM-dependent methyltransferase